MTKYELDVRKFFVVSAAQAPLPFALNDAMLSAPDETAYYAKLEELKTKIKDAKEKEGADEKEIAALEAEFENAAQEQRPVARPTRLDNRVLDLRTPANQAIFRIQSGVCRLFR